MSDVTPLVLMGQKEHKSVFQEFLPHYELLFGLFLSDLRSFPFQTLQTPLLRMREAPMQNSLYLLTLYKNIS